MSCKCACLFVLFFLTASIQLKSASGSINDNREYDNDSTDDIRILLSSSFKERGLLAAASFLLAVAPTPELSGDRVTTILVPTNDAFVRANVTLMIARSMLDDVSYSEFLKNVFLAHVLPFNPERLKVSANPLRAMQKNCAGSVCCSVHNYARLETSKFY